MDITRSLPRSEVHGPGLDGRWAVDDTPALGSARFQLRRMGLQDLHVVTDMHMAEFREGFFVRLGARFLRRYYRTFLDGPLATALVCESDGAVCGYLVGVLDPTAHPRPSLSPGAGQADGRRPRCVATHTTRCAHLRRR